LLFFVRWSTPETIQLRDHAARDRGDRAPICRTVGQGVLVYSEQQQEGGSTIRIANDVPTNFPGRHFLTHETTVRIMIIKRYTTLSKKFVRKKMLTKIYENLKMCVRNI
jgi:hypothetical protein